MDPRAFRLMAATQERHWWWAGRRAILDATLSALARAEALPKGPLYDLGCGVGANLPVLQRFGDVVGFDVSEDAVRFARARGFRNVEQFDLTRGAPGNRLHTGSVALLADVLEHLEDDRVALRLACDLLIPGGLLIVTVPALPWLWGPADEFNQHRRRYTKVALRAAVSTRFEIVRLSYFNCFLFPAVALGRLSSRLAGWPGVREIEEPPGFVNQALRWAFRLEAKALDWTDLPIGVSLLCIARKPITRG